MCNARCCLSLLAAVVIVAAAPARNESPVADAAMKRDRAAVKVLLQQGADVNAAQGDGMTALHWAAERGDVELTTMLLSAGARVEAFTRNGNYTPLHLASRAGAAPVIKSLLAADANVNAATTSGGATPLHFAAAQGSRDAISALLDKGANIEARETAFGQ